MRYFALACDYDGTLAHDGRVDAQTLAALRRLLAFGRKLILVSGRELDDLRATFPHTQLFEWLVLENGGLLYHPGTGRQKVLGSPPPEEFVQRLRAAGVRPLSVGRVILATWQPHENAVLEAIRDLSLEMQVIFNKGAVMVLPSGVNKATGLAAALKEMGLSPHNVVGVGDAENDHAFLNLCECSAAVANALPALKDLADLVTRGDHGAGVEELIDELIADDLAERNAQLTRHRILIGTRKGGAEVRLPSYGFNLLVIGPSGKSTLVTGLLERLAEQHYQFCVIDPEGNYGTLQGAVVLGTPQRAPTTDEVLQVFKDAAANVVVNLAGLPATDRPPFVLALLSDLRELLGRTGRPHWLVVDETHHSLQAWKDPSPPMTGLVRVTVQSGPLRAEALAEADTVIATGEVPEALADASRMLTGDDRTGQAPAELGPAEALLWERHSQAEPSLVQLTPGLDAERDNPSR